jgi:hypothetical protein
MARRSPLKCSPITASRAAGWKFLSRAQSVCRQVRYSHRSKTMAESIDKRRFLVVDDYGTGGIWFIVLAQSEDQIHQRLRGVKVWPPGTRPDWMSDDFFDEVASRRTFDIDNLPASAWMDRLREPHE